MLTPFRSLTVLLTLAVAVPALAQSAAPAPPVIVVEGAAGWVGFGDDALIHHTLVGAAARAYVTPRISLGPEVQFMVGPGSDRDLVLTGNVMVDVLAPRPDRPRRTTPFVVIGGGLFRHSDRFGSSTFASTEGAVTAGVGLRGWINERVYIAGDARLGWEPHVRVAATVGVVLK